MTKVFFTSDIHMFHANSIKYGNRPFKDVDHQNEEIIKKWNAKVSNKDLVYILGDLSFGNAVNTCSILDKLNGNKYLIFGNHDKVSKNQKTIQSYFVWCRDYAEIKTMVKGIKEHVVLSHYPFSSWNRSHHGSYHLHGHVHQNYTSEHLPNRLNVGMDICNYEPCTFDELIVHNTKWWEQKINDKSNIQM